MTGAVGGNAAVLGARAVVVLTCVLVVALAGFVAVASAYVAGGWLVDVDESVAESVAASMPEPAVWPARLLSAVGGLVGIVVVAVGAVVALWLRARTVDAALVVASVVGVQLLVLGLKQAYERPRPAAGSAVDLPGSFSFPSGHAATGIAVFGLIGVLAGLSAPSRLGRLAWGGAGLLLGAAIGASRVVLNVHYVSDVVAGALVGLAWLSALLLARALVEVRHAAAGEP